MSHDRARRRKGRCDVDGLGSPQMYMVKVNKETQAFGEVPGERKRGEVAGRAGIRGLGGGGRC